MATARESPTIRYAAIALSIIGLVSVLAILLLAFYRRAIPDTLATTAGAAVGGLATLLTTFSPAPLAGGRRASDPIAEPGEPAGTPLGPLGPPK